MKVEDRQQTGCLRTMATARNCASRQRVLRVTALRKRETKKERTFQNTGSLRCPGLLLFICLTLSTYLFIILCEEMGRGQVHLLCPEYDTAPRTLDGLQLNQVLFSRNSMLPMAQMVKNSPAMWENWVWSLGWEDPVEKGLATHSSILAWRSQWTEEPGGLQSTGMQRVGHDWATKHSTALLERRIDIFLSFFLFGCAS